MPFVRAARGSRFIGGGALMRAAQFTQTNNEYLSVATSADVVGAAAGCWRAAYVRVDSLPSAVENMTVFSTRATNTGMWLVGNTGSDKWEVFAYDATGNGSAAWGTAMVVDTWYFIVFGYDGTDIYISVDDGADVTTTDGFDPGAGACDVGGRAAVTNLDGRVQSLCGGDGTLSAATRTWLKNAIEGREHGEVGSGTDAIVAADLKFWWNLDEFSDGSGAVTRSDLVGSNDLIDNNTVTSTTGLRG